MKQLWASFRVRLLVASLIWTFGLLYVAHLTFAFFFLGTAAFGRPLTIVAGLVLALAFMAVGMLLVRRSMRSFDHLRERLAAVHDGRERAVTGEYPAEVQPLVDDLNALLDHHDRRVREALSKAGDLAHGLKTPLAVLGHEAGRLEVDGHQDLSRALSQQVERMRRHVDYHLAHARASASGALPGVRCSVAESARAIARTLERLNASRGLLIEVDVDESHAIRGQREDLDEMLGNLLDNACKWASARIVIGASNGSGGISITVDDDGPGIEASMREAVLQRGVRADEAAPGRGLGLAIVRDLAVLYGGSITLGQSPLGGLRATLVLPESSKFQVQGSKLS